MLHMLSYGHQGGGGGGGVLTSLTPWRILPLRYGTCTRCACCPMIIRGVGGCINVLDEYFPYVTEHVHIAHAVVWSLRPRSTKMAQVNHKQDIFTKTYHFRGRLWGKSYRTIVAGAQQMDGTWKDFKKWRPMSMLHKKNQQVYKKKMHLGLQLDMASQCCLVAVCGFCVATSALALKRREEEKTGRVNVALIWFGWLKFWSLKSKIESPRRRNANFHSWVTRLPIEMSVHVANIFDDSCKYQHFVS